MFADPQQGKFEAMMSIVTKGAAVLLATASILPAHAEDPVPPLPRLGWPAAGSPIMAKAGKARNAGRHRAAR